MASYNDQNDFMSLKKIHVSSLDTVVLILIHFYLKHVQYLIKKIINLFVTGYKVNTYLSVKKNSGFVWFHIDVQVGGRDDYGRNEYGVPALLQSQVTPDHLREEKLYMVHCKYMYHF